MRGFSVPGIVLNTLQLCEACTIAFLSFVGGETDIVRLFYLLRSQLIKEKCRQSPTTIFWMKLPKAQLGAQCSFGIRQTCIQTLAQQLAISFDKPLRPFWTSVSSIKWDNSIYFMGLSWKLEINACKRTWCSPGPVIYSCVGKGSGAGGGKTEETTIPDLKLHSLWQANMSKKVQIMREGQSYARAITGWSYAAGSTDSSQGQGKLKGLQGGVRGSPAHLGRLVHSQLKRLYPRILTLTLFSYFTFSLSENSVCAALKLCPECV